MGGMIPDRSSVHMAISYIWRSVDRFMQSIDVKEASDDLDELMDLAGRSETFEIVAGGRRAVLMSASEYSGLMETLHLLSDPTTSSDLIRARGTPFSEMTVWHPYEGGGGL